MSTRYFFDLHNGDGHMTDDVGLMIAESDVPRQVARILTDIARDEFTISERRGIITVKVRDSEGDLVSMGSLTFSYEELGP